MSIFSSQPKTVDEFKKMTMMQLVYYIQPRWSWYNTKMGQYTMTKKKDAELANAFTAFTEKGGDVMYFVSGSGAPGNCTIA